MACVRGQSHVSMSGRLRASVVHGCSWFYFRLVSGSFQMFEFVWNIILINLKSKWELYDMIWKMVVEYDSIMA